MPGRLMTAQQAKKEYGKKYKSIKSKGNSVTLKNSEGKKTTVGKNAKVYHRGKGNFGVYSQAKDKKVSASGVNQRFGKGSYGVGTGSYRHTHDGSASKQTGKTGQRRSP